MSKRGRVELCERCEDLNHPRYAPAIGKSKLAIGNAKPRYNGRERALCGDHYGDHLKMDIELDIDNILDRLKGIDDLDNELMWCAKDITDLVLDYLNAIHPAFEEEEDEESDTKSVHMQKKRKT